MRYPPQQNCCSYTSRSLTCSGWPCVLHACLHSIPLRLRAFGAVPIHDRRQALAGAGIAAALHVSHIQEGQRPCNIATYAHRGWP